MQPTFYPVRSSQSSSTALTGSLSRSSSGCARRVLPIVTRCFWPPLSSAENGQAACADRAVQPPDSLKIDVFPEVPVSDHTADSFLRQGMETGPYPEKQTPYVVCGEEVPVVLQYQAERFIYGNGSFVNTENEKTVSAVWLKQRDAEPVHCCLARKGRYGGLVPPQRVPFRMKEQYKWSYAAVYCLRRPFPRLCFTLSLIVSLAMAIFP